MGIRMQYRVKLDSDFLCNRSNVELKSTRYFTVFYVGFSLSSCHLEAAFGLLKN